MKKIVFLLLLLLIPCLNFSQSKDVFKIPIDKDIEIIDGFIFKVNKSKYESAYYMLAKEKYPNEQYVMMGCVWSPKHDAFIINLIINFYFYYDVKVNMFSPNEVKYKFNSLKYTLYFSKNEVIKVDEFGNKSRLYEGVLKSLNDIKIIRTDEGFE